jgi:hypothetical protein
MRVHDIADWLMRYGVYRFSDFVMQLRPLGIDEQHTLVSG